MGNPKGITDLIDLFWIPEFSEGFSTSGTIWIFMPEEEAQIIKCHAWEINGGRTQKIYPHSPKCNLIQAEVAIVDGLIKKVFPKSNSTLRRELKYNGDIPYHIEIQI